MIPVAAEASHWIANGVVVLPSKEQCDSHPVWTARGGGGGTHGNTSPSPVKCVCLVVPSAESDHVSQSGKPRGPLIAATWPGPMNITCASVITPNGVSQTIGLQLARSSWLWFVCAGHLTDTGVGLLSHLFITTGLCGLTGRKCSDGPLPRALGWAVKTVLEAAHLSLLDSEPHHVLSHVKSTCSSLPTYPLSLC